MGNIDVKAACRPSFLRASAALPASRNARSEASWVSSRNGTGSTLARLAKLFRMRFFSVKEYCVMDLDLFRFSHGIKPASADALPRKCIHCVGALHPRD